MKRKASSRTDYYAVLGVAPGASQAEIRDGYRRMAKRYHPDVAPSNLDHEERFRKINEAYDILGHPESRKDYDLDRDASRSSRWKDFGQAARETAAPETAEPEFARPTEKPQNEWFEDDADEGWDEEPERSGVFDKVFGYKRQQSESRSRSSRKSGPDVRYGDLETEVQVTLNEVLTGATRVINLRRKGSSDAPRQFTVEVPPGVRAGHVICLKGKGRTSLSRGTTGDLYVSVRYAPHPEFRIDGCDLTHTLVLRPWQFVLGDIVKVPTLEGSLQAKIPPGSIPGHRLKLRGHGLPESESVRGDLVLTLKLDIPQDLDSAARRAWEQVRDTDRAR